MTSDIEYYKQLSKKVSTKQDKINFFDHNQKAFYVDIYSDSWSKMMEEYAKAENLSSEQLSIIEEMKWIEMPDNLNDEVLIISKLNCFFRFYLLDFKRKSVQRLI